MLYTFARLHFFYCKGIDYCNTPFVIVSHRYLYLRTHAIHFTMLYKILTVAGLATFEIYAAIPAGFAMKLPAVVIAAASIAGGIAGAFIAAFLGEKIEIWLSRYRKPKPAKPKTGIVYRIWEKYGLIGLGLAGTFTVGAPISIAVGVGFNVPMRKLLFWCCIGVIVRCILFTAIGHFGLKLF
jgi:membrane protein YqaA with SNARE-associated domain